ncbi:hypothetical protein LHK12_00885 [Providencia rettgeri]|nr:hypothetical protein [Providencia rettgeri]
MADFNSLPDVIKPFVDKIKSTKKSLVEMTLTPVEDYILWIVVLGNAVFATK